MPTWSRLGVLPISFHWNCPLTYLTWSFCISAAWWWGERNCWDEHNKRCSICHYSINLSSASLFFYVILVYLGSHRIFLHWCCRGTWFFIFIFYYLYMYDNAYWTNIHILISHCLHLSSGDAFLYSCTGKKVTGNWVVLWVLDVVKINFVSHIYVFFCLFLHSKCRSCGQTRVNVPLFGTTTVMSLLVLLFCVTFAIFWVWTRKESYSWVGQDTLVSYLLNISTFLHLSFSALKILFAL